MAVAGYMHTGGKPGRHDSVQGVACTTRLGKCATSADTAAGLPPSVLPALPPSIPVSPHLGARLQRRRLPHRQLQLLLHPRRRLPRLGCLVGRALHLQACLPGKTGAGEVAALSAGRQTRDPQQIKGTQMPAHRRFASDTITPTPRLACRPHQAAAPAAQSSGRQPPAAPAAAPRRRPRRRGYVACPLSCCARGWRQSGRLWLLLRSRGVPGAAPGRHVCQ